jgi:hypothetical protein
MTLLSRNSAPCNHPKRIYETLLHHAMRNDLFWFCNCGPENAERQFRCSLASHKTLFSAATYSVCLRLEADLAEILPTGRSRPIAVDQVSEPQTCLLQGL